MKVCFLSPGAMENPAAHDLIMRVAAAVVREDTQTSILTVDLGPAHSPAPPPGVEATAIPALPPSAFQAPPEVRRSLAALEHLRGNPPGLLVVPEAGGFGFHVALMRRLGLAFGDTRILVLCLGPRAMRAALDGRLPAGREDLALDHLERCSLAWADVAVTPCGTSLAWLEREGWALPERRIILAPPAPARRPAATRPAASEREILFVGDLRRAAGLPLFVDALRRLPPARLEGWRVTLLGARGRERWAWDPAPWLAAAMPAGLAWQIEEPPPGDPAGRLTGGRGVVVIPALGPIPEAARHCLAGGIPFIGIDRPEFAALLPAEQRGRLTPPEPGALAAAIGEALLVVPAAAAPVPDVYATAEDWQACLAGVPPPASAGPPPDGAALSVVLVHRNRPALLAQALDGLRRQTLTGFEVVLVDDGSDHPDALAALDALEETFVARGWRILRGANQGLGAARNRGWRAARGRFVLFHDDDNVALPHQLATMLAGACHSGAGVLTCFFAPFAGDAPPAEEATTASGILAMLGGAVALGVFENCFGDAHALVRRDVLEALGGFTETRGLGHEDWEFFARATLAGHEVLAVPQVLFRYRVAAGSMIRGRPDVEADFLRNLSAYEALLPTRLRAALQLGFADTHRLAAMAAAFERSEAARRQAEAASDAARAEAAALTARLSATRRERDAAEAELAMIGAEAQGMARAIQGSASFAAVRRLLLRGADDTPLQPLAPRDEVARLVGLLGSRSWEATAPLRLFARVFRRR